MEQNLFDLLYQEFCNTGSEGGGCKDAPHDEQILGASWFIDFAKKYLKKNPAIGTATVAYGLALRLREGQVVLLAENEGKPENPVRGVFVTNPGFDPRGPGVVPSHSVAVTDPNK